MLLRDSVNLMYSVIATPLFPNPIALESSQTFGGTCTDPAEGVDAPTSSDCLKVGQSLPARGVLLTTAL